MAIRNITVIQHNALNRRSNYFGGEPIRRTEVEVRVGKLKNGKAADKEEVMGEMIKCGGDRVMDWIGRRFNVTFENGVVPGDWRSAVIVPLCKVKGERTECSNYRCTSFLSVVGKKICMNPSIQSS